MNFEYDRTADAVYILINDVKYGHSECLDETRFIDYGENGVIRGIELLFVGGGVELNSLPYQAKVKELLQRYGIKIYLDGAVPKK